MASKIMSALLLDADEELKSMLLPLCKQHKLDITTLDHLSSYETLQGILNGNNVSVLLIDESFFSYINSVGGSIRLQQDFPDIEIMMFGETIETKPTSTFRYFKKPINPEVVIVNIKLAARKNQISRRKRRALQTLQEASLHILENETEDEVLKSIVDIASQIMDETGRNGYFSHLAILADDSHLVYYPQHHNSEVFALLKNSLKERFKSSFGKDEYPAINLEKINDEKIGIVGIAVKEKQTQRIDDVTKIPDYIILHNSVHSQIAVPITHEDKIYGVLNVEYPELNAFDENDQAALEALAALIGIAITQMRLIEKERKQSTALKVLANMGKWVGEAARLDRDEIFRQAVINADDLMGAKDEGYLSHLFVKDGRKLKFSPAHHKSSVIQTITQILRGNIIDLDSPPVFEGKPRRGIVGRAIETGSIQRVGNVKVDIDYIPFSDGVNSQLAVPFKHNNEIIGAINIEHRKVNAFDEEDEENLNTLALYISIALKNAELYAEIRMRAEQYEVVYRAGQIISQYGDLDSVLHEIAKQSLRIVGDGDGGIDLFSHVSLLEDKVYLRIKSISPKALSGIYADEIDLIRKGFDLRQSGKRGISGLAFLSGTELNVPDVSIYAEDFVTIVPGVKSQLSVPVIEGSSPIGVISIESRHFNRFSDDYVDKIKLLAGMAAVSIKNSIRRDEHLRRSLRINWIVIGSVLFINLIAFTILSPWAINLSLFNTVNILAGIGTIVTAWITIRERIRRNRRA